MYDHGFGRYLQCHSLDVSISLYLISYLLIMMCVP
jgi:hypothetical protein